MGRTIRNLSWKTGNGPGAVVVDWLLILAGLALPVWVSRAFQTRWVVVWALLLVLYFLWYRRLFHVILWSTSTYRLLERGHWASVPIQTAEKSENLPVLHVLIAARSASGCITAVLRAAAAQDYPQDRYHVWAITEHGEREAVERERAQLINMVRDASAADELEPEALALLWRCVAGRCECPGSWVESLSRGQLRGLLAHPTSAELLVEDLFTHLDRALEAGAEWRESVAKLVAGTADLELIEREASAIRRLLGRTSSDFVRLLGNDTLDTESLRAQLVPRRCRKPAISRLAERIRRHWADPAAPLPVVDPTVLRRFLTERFLSTQECVKATIRLLDNRNLHHLDPINRAFKPGALNIAYREIQRRGLLSSPEKTFFIIIDADSLLPRQALSTIVKEIGRGNQSRSILQMVSIPTANFFCAHWLSNFIAFADAVGAVGKWARSTRRQLRPDLHAGSGVIIPATLIAYIEATEGTPWDESTITEDARLIIGQFGAMNLGSNKTCLVPVYLLEAVPDRAHFGPTYKSFWQQRQRWTKGGIDELGYMLGRSRAFSYSRFDPASRRWQSFAPSQRERLSSAVQRVRRVSHWIGDHLMWGVGGIVFLSHWWIFALLLGEPPVELRLLSLALLLATPQVFLLGPGRAVSYFVPGGIGRKRKMLLYLQSFTLIWIYCLPVAATQLACALGFGARLMDWKTTGKPGGRLLFSSS